MIQAASQPTRHLLTPGQRVYRVIKRILDFLIALFALLVLLIPMLILAAIVRLDDGGPVFFKQKRIGRGQKPFLMLKFRTMRVSAPHDVPTHQLSGPTQYITRPGRFLRKTSLDELPQLLNILVGQMSVVGPRPALWNQFDLIEARESYGVHQVPPGLTGWAQVNGRDELEIPIKAALDGEYVRRFGLKMDVICFFRTFAILFSGRGVVEGGTGELHRQECERESVTQDTAE